MQSKMKNLSSSQTAAHQANGVDAYIAAPSKKQKVANGEESGEKKKAKKSA